jgi:uncharacterized protein (DUF2336 family)
MPVAEYNLIDQLSESLDGSGVEKRHAALLYATDVLLTGHYSEEEIWVFGQIINRLAVDIELNARIRLATRLSVSDNAPFQTVRKLALDDSIEVAQPVLANSGRLGEDALLEVARSKSQEHLRAIAVRKHVSERVTDVLVGRGDREVVHCVAKNPGAHISEKSIFHMVKRCGNDAILVETLGERKDIPRRVFLQMIAKASEEVKAKMAPIGGDNRAAIEHAIADVTGEIQAKVGPASKEYYDARRRLIKEHRNGELSEKRLIDYIRDDMSIETMVALSLLSGLSVDAVERALAGSNTDVILLIAKSARLSWAVVYHLLLMQTGRNGIATHDIQSMLEKYSRLSAATARSVIVFFEARRRNMAH